VIDLHCHVLPGMDDGPATLEESVELCRAAHADGTGLIVATPHVNWEYPDVTAASIHAQVVAVNAALRASGVAVTVRPGAELALSRAAELSEAELSVMRLGGGPYVLLEIPWNAVSTGIVHALGAFASRSPRIVLAHPERTPVLQRNPRLVRELVESRMLCCLNARSLSDGADRQRRAVAWQLLEERLVHVVASDAHDPLRRPPMLRSVLEHAGLDEAQIDYFTHAAPEAIVHGAPVPPPPRVQQPRRLTWRRRGRRESPLPP